MALARWQGVILDNEGNVVQGATVTVRKEITGAPLAQLFSDRNGTVALVNPLTSDASGYVFFHAAGGAYRIDAVKGSFSQTWRYVAVGLGAESDAPIVDIAFSFSADTTDSDPTSGLFKFNNATLASVTTIYVDLLDSLGADLTSWLDRFDDSGSSTDRGILTIRATDGSAEFVGQVTGSVTAASGYRKIPVTRLSSTGTFVAGGLSTWSFAPRGLDSGAGIYQPIDADLTAIAALTTTTFGRSLLTQADAAATLATLGILPRKETIWVPALSLNVPSGPSVGHLTGSGVDVPYYAFDSTTEEFAWIDVAMPKSWDAGTITFKYYWAHPSTTTNFGVVWRCLALAYSDNEAIATGSFGAVQVADTGGTTSNLYISDETSALTIGSSPQDNDLVMLRFSRLPTDGSDTMTVDAFLIGIQMFYTATATTDA